MALYLIFLFLDIIPTLSQFSQSCQWTTEVETFSLQGAQGYEIQCIDGENAYGMTYMHRICTQTHVPTLQVTLLVCRTHYVMDKDIRQYISIATEIQI